jgi:hypothetical protein
MPASRQVGKAALKKMSQVFRPKPGEISGSQFMSWYEDILNDPELLAAQYLDDVPSPLRNIAARQNLDTQALMAIEQDPVYQQAHTQLRRFAEKYPTAAKTFRDEFEDPNDSTNWDEWGWSAVPRMMQNFMWAEKGKVPRENTGLVSSIVGDPLRFMDDYGFFKVDGGILKGVPNAALPLDSGPARLYKNISDALDKAPTKEQKQELADVMRTFWQDENPEFIESALRITGLM